MVDMTGQLKVETKKILFGWRGITENRRNHETTGWSDSHLRNLSYGNNLNYNI